MLEIVIPGSQTLYLKYLVVDFNGTIACDGSLLPGVAELLSGLAKQVTIHVVTADTFGRAAEELADVSCELILLSPNAQDIAKLDLVEKLGAEHCVCIGNGRNDRRMLAAAALGIAVTQQEGSALETLLAAKVAAPDIDAALGLLLNPSRLIATLRL